MTKLLLKSEDIPLVDSTELCYEAPNGQTVFAAYDANGKPLAKVRVEIVRDETPISGNSFLERFSDSLSKIFAGRRMRRVTY